MQNFTLHTHNNELRFDGFASAEEMIATAQEKGFSTIGVSNHLIMHHNLNFSRRQEPMFFHDFNQAQKAYMQHIEILENLKSKFKINIKIGFEVDFFQSAKWRRYFEKMITHLPVDYLIGSNHFLKNKDESFLLNIYHLKHLATPLEKEVLKEYTINHLQNIEQSVRSGYFNFIAHLDYCTIFNLAEDSFYDTYKLKIIDALKETNTPFELNTSGYDRINRPHPAPWLLKELSKNGGLVPVVISDDAHDPTRIGKYFDKAEMLLKELNYTNRLTLDMLKKPC